MGSIPSRPDASWISRGHIQTPAGLRLSFQRYMRSKDGRVLQPLPSSLGALPSALGRDGALLVPLAADEAFWIGLQADGSMPAVRLVLIAVSAGMRAAPIQINVSAFGDRIGGYSDAAGRMFSFARELDRPNGSSGCSRLECSIEEIGHKIPNKAFNFVIRLVDPVTFTNESGQPAPPSINSAGGYRGQLLP